VVIGGVLFGAVHLLLSGGLTSMVFATTFGFILAAGYERTENLTVPIIAHAGYWLVFVPL
jgi:membrane protease YdiL (CAAX protease family)